MLKPLVVLLAAGALAAAGAASASAPPVGPLPPAKVTTVKTTRGQLVSIALPTRRGYVWRVARPIAAASSVRSARGTSAGTSCSSSWRSPGRASIVLAETRAETAKAYRAVRYDVTVS
jgi:hypothetical protein